MKQITLPTHVGINLSFGGTLLVQLVPIYYGWHSIIAQLVVFFYLILFLFFIFMVFIPIFSLISFLFCLIEIYCGNFIQYIITIRLYKKPASLTELEVLNFFFLNTTSSRAYPPHKIIVVQI